MCLQGMGGKPHKAFLGFPLHDEVILGACCAPDVPWVCLWRAVLPCCVSRLLFKVLHKRHVPPHVEVATVLAGAYTVYLGTGERGA